MQMKIVNSLAGVVFFMLVATGAMAQEAAASAQDTTRKEMVRVLHSDNLLIIQEGDSTVKYVDGHIELKQDSTYMYCDSAVIINNNRVFAYDEITIQQGDSVSIFSDTLYYLADTMLAILKGEVVLTNLKQQLWTTELDYSLKTKIARYENHGTLYDDSTQLQSRRGIFDVGLNRATFKDSVFVFHPDFTLTADSILYLVDEETTIFLGPTRILQGTDREIYCEAGFYDIRNKVSEFRKRAQYRDPEKTATADTIRHIQKDSTIELIGHVDFQEGDRLIRSEYLKYDERTGLAEIRGNAFYADSSRTVYAEEILYNTRSDALQTKGKSRVNEGSQNLSAEFIDYDDETKLGNASGNVVWRDTASGYVIESDSAIYRKDIDYIRAFGVRKPLLKTEMDGDTLYLSADVLNVLTTLDSVDVDTSGQAILDSVRHFRAFYNVELYKSNMQGVCDSLTFNSRDSLFQFYRNPVLWSDTTQFVADSISMQMKDEKIDRFIMRHNGFIINQVNEIFYNQIKGKYITSFFEADEIKRIYVEGNAESVYYARDEEDAYIGVNRSICSEMEFLFENKQMNTVKFLTAPKSKMSPVQGINPNAMQLEGFRWITDMRPVGVDDLYQ